MAASAMELLPSIRILATKHLYSHFRANKGANGAARTLTVILKCSDLITGGIQLVRLENYIFRAKANAKLTSFAQLGRYHDGTFDRFGCSLFISHNKKLRPGLFARPHTQLFYALTHLMANSKADLFNFSNA